MIKMKILNRIKLFWIFIHYLIMAFLILKGFNRVKFNVSDMFIYGWILIIILVIVLWLK